MEEQIKPKREFVATVYIVKDGKVLLNLNNKLKKFIPVGGHVEENKNPSRCKHRGIFNPPNGGKIAASYGVSNPFEGNELPSDTAIREAKEESGFDIELISLRKFENQNLPQNWDIQLDVIKPDHHHINLSYIGKIIGGNELARADDGAENKWFSPEEIIESNQIFENTKEKALKAIELVSE